MSGFGTTKDAGVVQIRVQVVDMEAKALDLLVPTYIPAADLTQRIARDANLGAYWPDGNRRHFWLRARGRLLSEDETLESLGVVDGELCHLLPQPPEAAGVTERPPDYPKFSGYPAAGTLAIADALARMLGLVVVWAIALSVSQTVWLGLFPSVGLALLCTSLARHLWGGLGSALKIPLTALGIYLPLMLMAIVPSMVWYGSDLASAASVAIPAVLGGVTGVVMGWLAWFGPVEPLPKQAEQQVTGPQAAQAAQSVTCGLCGGEVDLGDPSMRADCRFECGRIFHAGCYRARLAVHRGQDCAVCGFDPGARAA